MLTNWLLVKLDNIYIYTATWIHPLDSDPTWKSQINFCPNFEWLFGSSSAGRSRRVGSVIHSWSLNSRFLVHAWLNHLIGTCVYTSKKNQAYVTNSFKSGCILWFRICALRLNGNRLCIIEEAETRATITGLSNYREWKEILNKNDGTSRFVNLSMLLCRQRETKTTKKVVDDHETRLNKCLQDD